MEKFTATEAQAFVQVPTKVIYKELDVLEAPGRPVVFFDTLVYLRAMRELRALSTIDLEIPPSGRVKLFAQVREALGVQSATLHISPWTSLDLGAMVRELHRTIRGFFAWKAERVHETPDIMGGEPVFRGSRLTVRTIGGRLERGEPEAEIREDYDYLSTDDLAYARLFVQAYPPRGRPTEASPR